MRSRPPAAPIASGQRVLYASNQDGERGVFVSDDAGESFRLLALPAAPDQRKYRIHVNDELGEMLGTTVYLELQVKVLKNWRSDERQMARFGYIPEGHEG